jgi:hypothetical protein
MDPRKKMDGARSLRGQEKRIRPQQSRIPFKWPDAFGRRRIDPVLSPKRESQSLLQWDGKIPPTRNGGGWWSADSFER